MNWRIPTSRECATGNAIRTWRICWPRGIDVYTTLNVQHLESRSDSVHDITAAPVQETVPDSVLAEADCIQLVDITPDQLRTRLREGKVYSAPQASAALDHFFKESNLTALRELARAS